MPFFSVHVAGVHMLQHFAFPLLPTISINSHGCGSGRLGGGFLRVRPLSSLLVRRPDPTWLLYMPACARAGGAVLAEKLAVAPLEP